MLRRLGLVFSALAMFLIAGGHWTVFQTVAWAEMIHDYSQTSGSLAVAIEKTFDGEHPCPICRQIEVAKIKEKQADPALPGMQDCKVKAVVASSALPGAPRLTAFVPFFKSSAPALLVRSQKPPTPPPRVV